MIRSVLTMTPKRGEHDRVVAFYEQRGILQRAVRAAGCSSVEMQLRLPDRDALVVSALWATRDDYAGWVASGGRADEVRELLGLLEGDPTVLDAAELFELVDAVDVQHDETGRV